MSWRTLRIACVCGLVTAAAASACGGNSSNSGIASSGGAAGLAGAAGTAGKAAIPAPVACGTKSCAAVVIPVQDFTIPGCCADAATNQCGLDSTVLTAFGPTFSEACQPLTQPGALDAQCADSVTTEVQGGFKIFFKGCCRGNHTCGYMLDKLGGLFPLGLGCVDSAPFLDGGTPSACGDSSGGAAGESAGG